MEMIDVKKSTLTTWCRDVELGDGQIAAIKERCAQQPGIPRDTQRKRRAEVERIRQQAKSDAEQLVREPLWVAGVALYWGEGSKTRRRLAVANSDPAALRLYKLVRAISHH